jgi:hypothetical protein
VILTTKEQKSSVFVLLFFVVCGRVWIGMTAIFYDVRSRQQDIHTGTPKNPLHFWLFSFGRLTFWCLDVDVVILLIEKNQIPLPVPSSFDIYTP